MVGGQSKKGRNKGKRKRRTIVHIEERKTTRGGGVFPATSRDWGGLYSPRHYEASIYASVHHRLPISTDERGKIYYKPVPLLGSLFSLFFFLYP